LTPPGSIDPDIRSTRGSVHPKPAPIFTIGHGARPADELVGCLAQAGVRTLVDVRRFPGSRRHPQFNRATLADTLEKAGIAYRHAAELGGRRSGEPGEEQFTCIETRGFRSYIARMRLPVWQSALAAALAEPVGDPVAGRGGGENSVCFMCAETLWWRCHRRFIAELLVARGRDVCHLISPGQSQRHRLLPSAEVRDGELYLCGRLVA
jgi:uncharacterized protein (DUF488 family)